MGWRLHQLRVRALGDERGWSLIEVLLSATILAVVLGAILSLSDTTAKIAPDDNERALLIQESRTALAGMTRELRQAGAVTSSSSTTFAATVQGKAITYDCGVAHPSIPGRWQCTRKEDANPAAVVANHLVSTAVFDRSGNYATVRLQVAAAGDRTAGHKHTITLNDGFFMRNLP